MTSLHDDARRRAQRSLAIFDALRAAKHAAVVQSVVMSPWQTSVMVADPGVEPVPEPQQGVRITMASGRNSRRPTRSARGIKAATPALISAVPPLAGARKRTSRLAA